jgi:hypothetical protein
MKMRKNLKNALTKTFTIPQRKESKQSQKSNDRLKFKALIHKTPYELLTVNF